jgi:predicted regulator of Ras-like GTPase activity (Roadblock/LC7/MglB family)
MVDGQEHYFWKERLNILRTSNPDIEGAAIITSDGKLIAALVLQQTNLDLFAAISANLVSSGARLYTELGRGIADVVYVQTTLSYIILCPPHNDRILVVTTPLNAKISLDCTKFLAGGTGSVAVPVGYPPKRSSGEATANPPYDRDE